MKRIKERICRCCTELFSPDYRNAKRQEYCAKPECRKASKVASQQKWLANNPVFFKGYEHVFRMREWRRANPGRSHRKRTAPVLQETCSPIPSNNQDIAPHLPPIPPAPSPPGPALQDFCFTQHPVFVGLIAFITGGVLQEDIAQATRRLENGAEPRRGEGVFRVSVQHRRRDELSAGSSVRRRSRLPGRHPAGRVGRHEGKRSLAWTQPTQAQVDAVLAKYPGRMMRTYAGEMLAWYLGTIDADVYFCPERQGTYFGSFFLKDIKAMNNPSYTIDSNMTADMGNAFLAALNTTQKAQVTGLVTGKPTCSPSWPSGMRSQRRSGTFSAREGRSTRPRSSTLPGNTVSWTFPTP